MTLNEMNVAFESYLVFPFCFNSVDRDSYADLLKRMQIGKLAWREVPMKPATLDDPPTTQNEDVARRKAAFRRHQKLAYLHPFMREALYGKTGAHSLELRLGDGKPPEMHLVAHLSHEPDVPVRLQLLGVRVHLFDLQMGILTLEVEMRRIKLGDVLRARDQLRRLVAPYIPHDDNGRVERDKAPVATHVKIEHGDDEFLSWEWPSTEEQVGHTFEPADHPLVKKLLKNDATPALEAMLDDRLFLHGSMTFLEPSMQTPEALRANLDLVSAIVHVDDAPGGSYSSLRGGGTLPDAEPASYLDKALDWRWSGSGTYHGFTRYATTAIGTEHNDFFSNVVRHNVHTVYYDLVLFALFQRAALVKFSERAQRVAEEFYAAKTDEARRLCEGTTDVLRRDFLLFTNKYWFNEVSNQDQGIEYFERLQRALALPELFDQVQDEVRELSEYLSALRQKAEGDRINALTKGATIAAVIGLVVAVASLAASLFSVGLFKGMIENNTARGIYILVICGLGMGIVWWGAKRWIGK